MPTPTKKPVDLVTVSLSDADFMRVVGSAMHEVLNKEYGGRIEAMSVMQQITDNAPDGWAVECAFIPSDD